MAATVAVIDKDALRIGPNGRKYSRRVADPDVLDELDVVDQVDITWETNVTVAVESKVPVILVLHLLGTTLTRARSARQRGVLKI